MGRHGEAASADKGAGESYATEIREYVDTGGFVSGRKCPQNLHHSREGIAGHKPMKDRLTLVVWER